MEQCRSPRQLWNALLPELLECVKAIRVAVPVNYGMLSYSIQLIDCTHNLSSQSPSIMECSPTLPSTKNATILNVAVPVNYGMLSYNSIIMCKHLLKGRSPRQLWNALLLFFADYTIITPKSQSPSIMECSPT